MGTADVAALDLNPAEETIRVYADISQTAYLKIRLRCAQVGVEKGRAVSRKEYLEYLIEQDIQKVAGSSARIVDHRMEGSQKTRRKDQK